MVATRVPPRVTGLGHAGICRSTCRTSGARPRRPLVLPRRGVPGLVVSVPGQLTPAPAASWRRTSWWSRTSISTTSTSTSSPACRRTCRSWSRAIPSTILERRLRAAGRDIVVVSTRGTGTRSATRGDWLTRDPRAVPDEHDAAVLFHVGGPHGPPRQRRPDLAGAGAACRGRVGPADRPDGAADVGSQLAPGLLRVPRGGPRAASTRSSGLGKFKAVAGWSARSRPRS